MRQTTLENSYCIPNDKEWGMAGMLPQEKHLGIIGTENGKGTCLCVLRDGKPRRRHNIIIDNPTDFKELTFQQMLDLLGDKIVPWRVEEIGFSKQVDGYQTLDLVDCKITVFDGDLRMFIRLIIRDEDMPLNITTFTELQTQIKFLSEP